MLLRLPWLLSRRRLLTAIAIDSGLFSFLYAVAFRYRFGSWPGLSFNVSALVAFWLLIGYVIGRYQVSPFAKRGQFFTLLFLSGVTLSASLGVYLSYFWFTAGPFGAKDSRGFLVPLLLVFTFFSTISQFLLALVIHATTSKCHHWLLLGVGSTQNALANHMAWSRLPASLCMITKLHQLEDLVVDDYAGVVVSDFNALTVSQQQQLLRLQQKGLLVLGLVDWSELVLQRFPPEFLTNADLLSYQFSLIQSTMQLRLKRLGDVLVSCALLVLTAPILVITALLIRLQDGGPALYGQLRSGLGGEPYRIWKLRTMREDAERFGAQWVSRGDSRVTPLGRLLRLTRLDELPQLWAVLLGDMSLIGPRPERPEFERDLECQIPHYRLRHLMRPGLSGWAQVNYPYGASVEDAANKLSYDLYYLRNFSCLLDLLILFKTIRMVFNAQGALPQSLSDDIP